MRRKIRELQEKLNQLRQLSESYPSGNDDDESRDSRILATRNMHSIQDDRSSVPIAPEVDELEQIRARRLA